jgi:putative acetyltransferase
MVSIRAKTHADVPALFDIWRRAVIATHHFLSAADFAEIEALVRDIYLPAAELWVAADESAPPVGFIGLSGAHIDALFVAPNAHGRGVGRRLVEHARGMPRPLSVDVNEQNEGALAFYRRLGFRVSGRSPTDDQGRPYPLLHLRL